MNEHQSMTPEHEPEADSGERPSPLEAQMQAAAVQIAKMKVSLKLLQTVSEGQELFGRLAAGKTGFTGAAAAAHDFGAAMAEVNRITEAGLDEEDE